MACTSICTSENIALPVPCPAWFLVDAALGPLRSDGMSQVFAMFCATMLRSGMLFSDNVSNFKAHKFWKLIACAMEWLNFGIQWNLSLDLRDMFPQASDRAIMIWVDNRGMDTLRTESVRWPSVRMHTLRTSGVVGDLERG